VSGQDICCAVYGHTDKWNNQCCSLFPSDAGATFGSTSPSVSKPLQDFQIVKRQKSDKIWSSLFVLPLANFIIYIFNLEHFQTDFNAENFHYTRV
jgi:hypothetical protein